MRSALLPFDAINDGCDNHVRERDEACPPHQPGHDGAWADHTRYAEGSSRENPEGQAPQVFSLGVHAVGVFRSVVRGG